MQFLDKLNLCSKNGQKQKGRESALQELADYQDRDSDRVK